MKEEVLLFQKMLQCCNLMDELMYFQSLDHIHELIDSLGSEKQHLQHGHCVMVMSVTEFCHS